MIAARHLTTNAENEINTILQSENCGSQQTVSDKLVCIVMWPDGSRFTTHKNTYNWHFVDISLQNTTYDRARDCEPHNQATKGKCGLVGLEHSLNILRKEITDPKITRAQALKFIVHIVGDLHQPLHTVHEGLGGNNHTAKYFNFWSQMHKVWDSKIIGTRMMKLGKNEKQYAAALDAEMNASIIASYQQGNRIEWLEKAHARAIDDSYGWRFKEGKATDNAGRKYPWLRTQYYDHNVPVVEEQLKRAGARLAKILNDALN
jgi:S1/P1 Nuclease